MVLLAEPIQNLIDALSELPGVGRKSATRLAFYLVKADSRYIDKLSACLSNVKEKICYCEICSNFCSSSPCELCCQQGRDHSLLCVVESPQDLMAIEATGEYRGMYHVLHGVIDPLNGISPNDIKMKELLVRLQGDEVREVILATNPSIEGEATAMYIRKLVTPLGIRVSRLASGLPMGAQLEFADKATLGRSLLDRRFLD